MKKLMAATTALTLLTATVAVADEAPTQPNMSIEFVTQDTADNAWTGDVLVPVLTMIFLFLTLTGGDNYVPM